MCTNKFVQKFEKNKILQPKSGGNMEMERKKKV